MPDRARVQLVLVLAIEVGAAAWLLPTARARPIPLADLGGWLTWTRPEQVAVTIVTWIGLGLSLWLLATTTLALVAAASGVSAAGHRVIARASLPAIRRLCAAATAPTLLASAVPMAGALDAPLPPPVEQTAGPEGDTSPTPEPSATPTEPSTGTTPSAGDDTSQDTPPPVTEPPGRAGDGLVTVVAGDNLWVMTARWLAAQRGVACEDLTDREIAEVWRIVVRENGPRLRSGDPNLIFPGESVLLPAP